MMKSYKLVYIIIMIGFLIFCSREKGIKVESVKDSQRSVPMVQVAFVSGDSVSIREGKTIKLEQGMQLSAIDMVQTGKNGIVEIVLENTGIVKITKNSQVSISSLISSEGSKDTQVNINYGKVVTLLKKERKSESFNVVTPTMIAGVRGTSFMVSVENKKTDQDTASSCDKNSCVIKFSVIEGSIQVSKPGSKEELILEKNMEITVDKDKKLTQKLIRPLNKDSVDEMKKIISNQKVEMFNYASLMDELKTNSPELRALDRSFSLEDTKSSLNKKESSRSADEISKTATKTDESKYIRKDENKENLKLKTEKDYE